MHINCRKCGFTAGFFNLRDNLCKSCRTIGKTENKNKSGVFSCKKCGHEAGLFNLLEGLCHSCRNIKDDASQHSKNANKENEENNKKNNRVFSCPICKQKIRIHLPILNCVVKCVTCDSKFTVYADNQSHLYIESINENKATPDNDAISSIDDCFRLLNLSNTATRQDIKNAYRKNITEYHPDKVNALGGKIKVLANLETKKLNYAITMLKENGYV